MLSPIVRETVRNGNRVVPGDVRADPRGRESALGAQSVVRVDVSAR